MTLVEDVHVDTVLRRFAQDGEFGYSPSIVARTMAVLASGVHVLNDQLTPALGAPADQIPLDWLCVLERDPVVRSATETALSETAHTDAIAADSPLSGVLAETLAGMARRSDGQSTGEAMPPLPVVAAMTGARAFGPPATGDVIHILTPTFEADTAVSRAFWSMFRRYIHDSDRPQDQLLTPSSDQVEVLQAAVELLTDVVPELAFGVFAHTPSLCVVTAECTFKSMSHRSFPGTIFVSEQALGSVWTIADALLHEALHHKLLDLHLISSMTRADVADDELPMVVSPWNAPPNEWVLGRALFAFHVYAHLTAFATCAQARAGRSPHVPPANELNQMRTVSGRRARYLGSQVMEVGQSVLSPRGQRLCRWLMEQTVVLDDGTFTLGPI